MYHSDVSRALSRRWKVIVLGLIVTISLGGAASRLFPATYQAKASVLLLPPNSSLRNDSNPYLALGGLQEAADVLSRAMLDPAALQSIRRAGAQGTYVVATDQATNGPVLSVSAAGPTTDATLSTLRIVLSQIPPAMARLQSVAGVPANAVIRSLVLAEDQVPSAVRKTQKRMILVFGSAGIVMTLLAAATLDRLLTQRHRRNLFRQSTPGRSRPYERVPEKAVRESGSVRNPDVTVQVGKSAGN